MEQRLLEKDLRGAELRILLVEDDPRDAELLLDELRRARIRFEARRVDDETGFLATLAGFTPELILSDYNLGPWNALDVLKLARERAPGVPVVIVTSSVSEEAAVECMKSGAADYVLKEHLHRLRGAVWSVLEQRRLRREKDAAVEGLRRSEHVRAAIVQAAQEGIVVADRSGRIVDFSPSAERIFGRSREETLGRDLAETLIPPALREQHRRFFARSFAPGEPGGPGAPAEITAMRADGTEFPAEILMTPLPGEEPSLVVGFVRDLTRERRIESELRLVTDAVPALISYVDRQGRYVYVNRGYQEWFGLEPERVRGRHMREILGEAAWERIRPHVERALRGERADYEAEVPYARGGTRAIRAAYVPDKAPTGAVRGFVVLVTDVTEERRARERDRFLADAGARLSSSLETERTLETLAELAVPRLADWCAILLRESEGERLVALVHKDPTRTDLVRTLLERHPPDPDEPRGYRRVLTTGRSDFHPEIPDSLLQAVARSPEHLQLLRSLGIGSSMSVPIALRGKIMGVISFASSRGGHIFTPSDLAFAEELGRRAAYALENARLYQAALESGRRAQRHRRALFELTRGLSDDLGGTLSAITEKVVETLDVERVGVWRFSADHAEIVCEDLYARSSGHEQGIRLRAADYPRYFAALEESRGIAAHDARSDPRTSEFREGYLEPLGIRSMLDVPIRRRGALAGIVCHEHTGAPRTWTPEEEDFAASIADLASLAFEAAERRRAEEARSRALAELEEEHARLIAVLAQMRSGLVIAEAPSGRLVLGNQEVERIFRHPFIPARDVSEYRLYKGFRLDGRPYEPEDWPLARSLRRGEVVQDEEMLYERGDGSRGVLLLSSAPIRDRDGGITAAVATFHDITDRKRAEEAVREIGRRERARVQELEAMMDSVPAIVLVARDPQAREIVGNRTSYEALRMRPGLNASATGSPESTGHFKVFEGDRELPPWDLPIQRAIRTGRDIRDYEEEIVFADGTRMRLLGNVTLLRDPEGGVRGAVAAFVDVTERKAREREHRLLAEAGALLTHSLDADRMLEAIPGLAVPSLADGCILDLVSDDGKLRRAGYVHRDPDVTERAREGFPDALPPDRLPPSALRVLRDGVAHVFPEPSEGDHRADAADDAHARLLRETGARSGVLVPLRARGRVAGTLLLVRGRDRPAFGVEDVRVAEALADRAALALDNARLFRRLERVNEDLERRVDERTAELRGALREIEAFAYTIAHDLRAPVRAMTGFSHALLDEYGARLDEPGLDYLRRIRDAGKRMDAMIRDLLQYSRVTRGEAALDDVPLEDVVERALAELSQEIEDRNASIDVVRPLPRVRAHPLGLSLAIQNLIANAVKFVPAGVEPRIRIRPEEGPERLRLWVEDNGIGIAPEHHERIFGVFERLHGVEVYPGTGIGLAIVRKSMERMRGRAGVESEPGRGSRFFLEFPRTGPAAPPP